jgi:hypothetical protein
MSKDFFFRLLFLKESSFGRIGTHTKNTPQGGEKATNEKYY